MTTRHIHLNQTSADNSAEFFCEYGIEKTFLKCYTIQKGADAMRKFKCNYNIFEINKALFALD